MAFGFIKKTWKNRISEYPTRRTLTKEDGSTELVTVARSEGTISQEGDAFSADNLNDLETRVDNALTEVNSNLENKFNEGTNIMSYNSESNPFVVPNDGLVLLNSGTGSLSLRNIRTETLPFDGIISTIHSVNSNYTRQFINVYKGMKIYVQNGLDAVYFAKK